MHRREDEVPDLERVVQYSHKVKIFRTNLSFRNEPLLHPPYQTAPEIASEEHYREVFYLSGLDERKGLEEFIERAEPSGEDHES